MTLLTAGMNAYGKDRREPTRDTLGWAIGGIGHGPAVASMMSACRRGRGLRSA